MKTSLVLGAAALLASTIAAGANGLTNTTTEIQLNGQVQDTFEISQYGLNFVQVHDSTQGRSYGGGMEATTKAIYKGVLLSDFAKNGNEQVWYNMTYPFVTGGHWIAYETNGRDVQRIGGGTYTVVR